MEVSMRNVTFALVLLAAGAAGAQKGKDAAAAAKAALDKSDEAFNAHDAKALAAMLDKTYFGAGPTVSAKYDTPEAMSTMLEGMLAKGGHITREAVTIKPDEDGNSAWYVADYTFVPKVPPGALPVHRKMRESGVLVKHGKEWKFAMTHMSLVQLDEGAPMAPPSTAAPMKK
jgi:ketosteroid isomerase-like protein